MIALFLLDALAGQSTAVSDFWVGVLSIYGPAALLVFFVFVLERRAWHRIRDTSVPKHLSVPLYAATWTCIFGFALAVAYFYWHDRDQEATIRGNVSGLSEDDKLWGLSADDSPTKVYVSRLEKTVAQVYWRIISRGRQSNTSAIFYVSSGKDLWQYRFPITEERYKQQTQVQLNYNRDTRELGEIAKGGVVPLAGGRSIVTTLPSPPRRSFEWFTDAVVHAQSTSSVQRVVGQLDSADPFARVQARSEFARLGHEAVPFIQEILLNPQSAQQQRLGALVALNRIQGLPADPLTSVANCQIARSVQDNDPVIREEASTYMKTHSQMRVQDGCFPPNALLCASPLVRQKLKSKQSFQFEVDDAPIVIYLVKTRIRYGKSDGAELVVLRPPKGVSQLDSTQIEEVLKSLSVAAGPPIAGALAKDTVLAAGQYDRQEVGKGDVVRLKLPSGYQFAYRVDNARAVLDKSVELQLCK